MTGVGTVPGSLPAPVAPGRLGEALEPEAALTYLQALGDWLARRRSELDALDREVLASAEAVAAKEGIRDSFRLVFNTGPAMGQTVFHVHAHVLGGGTPGFGAV